MGIYFFHMWQEESESKYFEKRDSWKGLNSWNKKKVIEYTYILTLFIPLPIFRLVEWFVVDKFRTFDSFELQ